MKPKLGYIVQGTHKNTQKEIHCTDCNETPKKLFRVQVESLSLAETLERKIIYLCEFCLKMKAPYFFKKNKRVKDKTLDLFQEEK